MSSTQSQLVGVGFALITATVWTSGKQSVQALDGYIPEFQLNTLRLMGKGTIINYDLELNIL